MATTADRAANDSESTREEDLREAVGMQFFRLPTIIKIIAVVVLIFYYVGLSCATPTTVLLGEHRSIQNPVSSEHSDRPVVDLSSTFNFRGGAYVSVRRQGLKGVFNVHIIVQEKAGAGKRPSGWVGLAWLKDLFSYIWEMFGFQRGHLVTLADMISPEDKKLTNELENNIVPIHKDVNVGNMSAVERHCQKLAENGKLVVYTGCLGELPLGGIEGFEEFIRAHYKKEETVTEKIEEVQRYLEPSNGLIPAPKYLFKLVLRKDTYEFVCCAVISNDVEQATDDPTLPTAGPPPEGTERVDWEKETRGRTRWLTEEAFFKWCKKQFPDYLTPQKCINDARMLKMFSTLDPTMVTCWSILLVHFLIYTVYTIRRSQAPGPKSL